MRHPKRRELIKSEIRHPAPLGPADTRELARLVKKYGRLQIAKLTRTVPRPRRGRRCIDNPFRPIPPLTSSDSKELMRLVGKKGRDFIAEAAAMIPQPDIGRPATDMPMLARIHEADWIEEVAQEHREGGSKQPYRDAELDVYEMTLFKPGKRPDVQKFLETLKRRRIEGRKELKELREAMQRLEASVRPKNRRR